ncbi:MAG TPA: glycine cleavage system protein H [Sulfurospirillum sp. UBA11407]|jgi:glycine cleavage system H protein|nr:MAG TPA: glycine cleavage system protein H [Sulfurospirillum sp. UBA11407]
MKKYSNEHEWAQVEGDEAIIGLSVYAVEQLGDITFLELPEIGRDVSKDESVAFIESVKAASDIYSPLSGEVIAVNEALNDTPELLNEDATNTWVFKLKLCDANEANSLMDEAAYLEYIATL